jgi:hypothetical protein
LKIELTLRLLDDDAVFNSIMSSNCRLKFIKITVDYIFELNQLQTNRLWQIIEKFGKDVKGFEMSGKVPVQNIIQLLNLMPNLKIVELSSIFKSVREIFINGKLELHKLRIVKCHNVSASAIEIFDQLPADVLEEIELVNSDPSYNRKLFPNQRNIEKIKTDKRFASLIDLKCLKLKSLEFFALKGFDYILVGQDQMKSFTGDNMNQKSLKAICDELKSLDELDISHLQFD